MIPRLALAVIASVAVLLVAACESGFASEERDDRFALRISVPTDGHRAGKPIVPRTTLTFLGPEARMTVFHAASPVGFRIEQLDGQRVMGGGMDMPCLRTEMARGEPVEFPFQKAGIVGDDATGFGRAWFEDTQLTLPVGRWRIHAYMETSLGECGGARHRLETSIDVRVVP